MFLYLPLTKARGSRRFAQKAFSSDHHVILDLEDTAYDIFDSRRTITLKQKAREGLSEILPHLAEQELSNTYIRVNALDTPFVDLDLDYIHKLCIEGFRPAGLFIPKVSSRLHLFKLKQILDTLSPWHPKLILMIESEQGFSLLEDLTHAEPWIYGFHYGHFDYCLSESLWPFPEYGSSLFWINTGRILQAMKKTGISVFVQSPYPMLEAGSELLSSIHDIGTNILGIHYHISVLGYKVLVHDKPNNADRFSADLRLARDLVRQFSGSQASDRSFASLAGKFTPPHEYLAAVRFLKNLK